MVGIEADGLPVGACPDDGRLAAGRAGDAQHVDDVPIGIDENTGGFLEKPACILKVHFRVVFERRFKPSEGLGPLYNATSCASCHSTPTTGGSSAPP